MTPRWHPAPFLLALAVAGLPPGARTAAAQEIAGLAVDSAGRPLPAVPVALHRVGGGGGASVDAAATDAEGRFRFAIDAPDSAVYFVALRHDGRMYIGPPARGGAERVTDYVVRASAGNEVGAVASALSGGGAGALPGNGPTAGGSAAGGPAAGAGAVWLVLLLALGVAVLFLTTAPGYRRRRRREMLMELAGAENRLAAAGPEVDTAADRRRRDTLRERLGPAG